MKTEHVPLSPDELLRVQAYIDRASRVLARCPVADFCDDDLQELLSRYLATKGSEADVEAG